MINLQSNIEGVTNEIRVQLQQLYDKEILLRPVCFDVIDLMTNRIHMEGKASDGAQIGTYSEGYLAVRTGNYANSKRVKKGPNKGAIKDAGTFTKGDSVGAARPKYNRTADPKVVISLTRKLENDWSVIATEKGYGIGFLDPHNFDKSQWVQQTYNRRIFDMTEQERAFALERLNDIVKEQFT